MKILDRYILTIFLKTFFTVFIILFFIFILQGIWLFINDLAGKDLDFFSIIKFISFYLPSIVPMVLPLSVLLASIMTFGDLSENYEFAAMKSAGVSLQRSMRSLIIFIFGLSIASFFFANNVIPYSQYKFTNFKRSIAQVKPAMAIVEGQFSKIGDDFIIKVEKKLGEKGNKLEGITIYKKSNEGFGGAVIKAKTGELISSEQSNILQFVLYDGGQYEDIIPKKYEDRPKLPFTKTAFKKYIFNIDLSKLNKIDENTNEVSNANFMLKFSELKYTIDSLNKTYKKDLVSFSDNIHQRTIVNSPVYIPVGVPQQVVTKTGYSPKMDILENYTLEQRNKFIEIADGNVTNVNYSILSSRDEMFYKQKNIYSYWIAIHEKFVIAFSCLLMFFIGAPLGAIIRKGGLGLPIVFAVLIFIIFHFINTFGKKVAGEAGMTPFMGCWLSSMVLLPLAILLTYRATNDSGLINFEVITLPIENFFKRVFSRKVKE